MKSLREGNGGKENPWDPKSFCSQDLVSSTLGNERLTSIRDYLHKTKTKGKLCVRGICTHHPSRCARASVG